MTDKLSPFAASLLSDAALKAAAQQHHDIQASYLERMAAAFLCETGLPASMCELVEQRSTDGMKVTWFYRVRDVE